jgi:hypothetical protein
MFEIICRFEATATAYVHSNNFNLVNLFRLFNSIWSKGLTETSYADSDTNPVNLLGFVLEHLAERGD